MLHDNLLVSFGKIAKKIQDENNLKEIPLFLPINFFIKILKNNKNLRLSKIEILGLIAYADCYDLSGLSMDYLLFVDYATEAVVKLNNEKTNIPFQSENLESLCTSDSNVRIFLIMFYYCSLYLLIIITFFFLNSYQYFLHPTYLFFLCFFPFLAFSVTFSSILLFTYSLSSRTLQIRI